MRRRQRPVRVSRIPAPGDPRGRRRVNTQRSAMGAPRRPSMDRARPACDRRPSPPGASLPWACSNPTAAPPSMFRGLMARVTRARGARPHHAAPVREVPAVCGAGWESCAKSCSFGAEPLSGGTCVIGYGTVQLCLPRRPPGTPEVPLRRAVCSHVRVRLRVFAGHVHRAGGELSAGTSDGPLRSLCSCSSGWGVTLLRGASFQGRGFTDGPRHTKPPGGAGWRPLSGLSASAGPWSWVAGVGGRESQGTWVHCAPGSVRCHRGAGAPGTECRQDRGVALERRCGSRLDGSLCLGRAKRAVSTRART